MAELFISYRRADAAAYAGWLANKLSDHFGEQNVFRDIESIEPGVDFVEALQQSLETCDVVLVVISRSWLTTIVENERQGHEDYSRLEVATVLKRNVRVIPILVQGASMPRAEELPDDLTALSHRNAFELRDTHWASDVGELLTLLEKVLDTVGIVRIKRKRDLWLSRYMRMHIYLDGVKVASLSHDEEIDLAVKVGTHSIKAGNESLDDLSQELSFHLREDEIIRFICGSRRSLTARCSEGELMGTWVHEWLLRRPQTEDSLSRRTRGEVQDPSGPHLRREPLLGQALRQQG